MAYLTALTFTIFTIYLFATDIYWGRTGDKLSHPYWNLVANFIISGVLTWVLFNWVD